ncbi:MAG: hypothetical protein GY795_16510 [Desulfobacterales bacterium]|nr:hypothetical protein [Desulfobacterales bacterium]
MFGLIKECHLNCSEKQTWTAHMCGLCLALKENHGQLSRLATNSDAVLLSVLCEAQSPEMFPRTLHSCAFHKFRKKDIVKPDNAASQYAAAISVLIGASKIADHVIDKDTWIKYFPNFFYSIASRWNRAAHGIGKGLGFNTQSVESRIKLQLSREQQQNKDFTFYSHAIEEASAETCSFTADISGCRRNKEILYHVGQMFGRIIYLLDSYRDYASDTAHNKFNALAKCYPKYEIQDQAKKLFVHAHSKLRHYISQLKLFHPDMISGLFIHKLERIGFLALEETPKHDPLIKKKKSEKKQRGSWCKWCDCCDCDCFPGNCGDGCD